MNRTIVWRCVVSRNLMAGSGVQMELDVGVAWRTSGERTEVEVEKEKACTGWGTKVASGGREF